MSFIGSYNETTQEIEPLKLTEEKVGKTIGIKNELSTYLPDEEEKRVLMMIRRHFQLGYLNMYTPRVELNDLSIVQRAMADQMSFNTYQPNNGDGYWGDEINNWRSRAIRPIVRNKVISIAAHATARLLFPKVFAWNEQSDDQKEAAQVMSDLMEVAGEQSDYAMTTLYNTLSALVNPYAVVYTEFCEVKRRVKMPQPDGLYEEVEMEDEIFSGFKDEVVSPDEMFIANFFEPEIQKQPWVIRRRVIPYENFETLFPISKFPNAKHVKPGVQTIYNDANQTFYWVYDPNMRPYMVERVTYWNRALDLKIEVVNGVMLTKSDNPNPRNDKLFPFTWTGYEIINSRCAAFKSLAFKLMHDANIINTLYPMIIDGTYLNMFPAMVIAGEENIGSNVITPGRATALSNPQATVTPIQMGTNLKAGFDALSQVEQSVNQSSENPPTQQNGRGQETAYEISVKENERNTTLGLFVQMIGHFVKQYGRLRMGDILQYMTIADVEKIEDNPELVYKTFVKHNAKTEGSTKHRKIKFTNDLPSELPVESYEEDLLELSHQVLEEQGGDESEVELYLVNPELYRNYKYQLVISPDVMNPLSESVERAYNLEVYDRAINNQIANQEAVLELLLESTPTTKKNPSKFIQKQNSAQAGQPQIPGQPAQQQNPAMAAMSMQGTPQPTSLPQPMK